MKFKTTIVQSGNNTGIEVPEAIVMQLGAGKKPPVVVNLNGYTYRNTIAVMGDKYYVGLSAEHRKKSGVAGGATLEVEITLDTEPRTVALPEDLAAKLNINTAAAAFYETLSPSLKKKMVVLIDSAKTEETRSKRIDKYIADLALQKKP